jgi:EAL domain-containing protein (putative c-di-GMP-specific phosphodiesterase class I)
MGLEVIAEGVETQAQLDYLQHHGCHLVQGFYLHKPMNQTDLIQEIESK